MTIPTFIPGAVLTASQMNQVAQQVVVTCTSTTRPSSPPEGMTIYETDTDCLTTFDGTNWVRTSAVTTTAVQTWTPVVTQSGTVSHTANEARYVRNGCVVSAWASLTMGASGTANNPVVVTLPVTGSGHLSNSIVGSGVVVTPTNTYTVVAYTTSGLASVAFRMTVSGNSPFGATPNLALASGDTIRFQVTYTV